MVLVNYSGKEINAKIVYYGPGLCGKTTNLEYIYSRVPQPNRGKMVSMKTRTERTLFFDFLPLNLGNLAGFQTRFLLYTVPGQVYYNATRKLVLKGVDALIFVADSGRGKMDENIESFENLGVNLREHGLDTDSIPVVLQYNKRDLPEVYSIQELDQALNPHGRLTTFEATATTGVGVFETFKGVARLLLAHLSKSMGVPQQENASGRSAISEALERPNLPRRPASSGAMAKPAPPAQAPPEPPPQAASPGASPGTPAPAPAQPTSPASAPASQQMPGLDLPPALSPDLSIVHGEKAAQDRTAAGESEGGERLVRVPVFVSRADIEAGVTIELVLRVDQTAADDADLRRHFG